MNIIHRIRQFIVLSLPLLIGATLCFLTAGRLCAQPSLPLHEPFDYDNNERLGGATSGGNWNWGNSTGTGSTLISNQATLSYSGLPAGTGRGLWFTSTTPSSGRNRGRPFQPVALSTVTQAVYYSFLLNVQSPPGGLKQIFALSASTNSLSSAMTVFLTPDGRLALGKNSSTAATITNATALPTNTTHLVVVRLRWVSGTSNDELALWLNPGSLGVGEGSVPSATITTTSGSDASTIGSLAVVHQTTPTPPGDFYVDEVRIGLTWAEVTPTGCTPPTAYSVTGGGSLCSGDPGVAVGLANSDSGVDYRLIRNGTPTGTLLSGTGSALDFGPQTVAGTYTVQGSNTTTACVGPMNGSAVVTVLAAPSISTQPTPQTAPLGGTASFTVVASGAGLSYQWRRDGTNLSNGGPISGANTATLTINPVAATDAATGTDGYDVVVSGTCSPSVTSTRVGLTVLVPNNLTWVGDGSANVWNTVTANWTGDATVFANNDNVLFDDTGSNTPAIDMTEAVSPSAVVFNATQNYTLGTTTTGRLAGAASLVINGTGTVTLTSSNSFTGPTTVNAGKLVIGHVNALSTSAVTVNTGVVEIANLNLGADPRPDLTLNNGATLRGAGGTVSRYSKSGFPSVGAGAEVKLDTASATDQLEIGSAVRNGSAASVIEAAGPGTIYVASGATAATAYAGSWELTGGRLRLGDLNALGNPGGSSPRPITLLGGVFEPAVSSGGTYGNPVSVAANSAVVGNRISSGAGVTQTLGALTVGNHTLAVGTGGNVTSGTGTLAFGSTTLAGDATFHVTNGVAATTTLTLGAIGESGGSRSLTKSGNGTLSLASASSYSGGTVLSAGILAINHTNALGTGPLTLAGGTLQVLASLNPVMNNLVLSADSTITGGNVEPRFEGALGGSAGTLTLSGTAATFQPRFLGAFTFNRPIVLDNANTRLRIYNIGSTQVYNGVISGPGAVHRRTATGGLQGTAIFNAANTFSGGFTLTEGYVGLGSSTTGDPITSGPLGTGTLTLGDSGNSDLSVRGFFASGGTRTVANPIVFSTAAPVQTNVFTGSHDLTFTGPVTLNTNRLFVVNNSGVTTFAGPISNGATSSGLTKQGTGELRLNGTNTYTGSTVVEQGTLSGTGILAGGLTVGTGGTLAPGASLGIFSVSNSATLGGALTIEVHKAPGPTYTADLLAVLNTLNCGGTVTVIATGDPLVAGDEFTVLSAGTFTGSFSSISPGPGPGLAWDTVKLPTEGKLLVHANPVANPDVAAAVHGSTNSIGLAKLLANDTGETGETLSIIAVASPTSGGGTATLGTGAITYVAPGSGATDSITYTLSDGRGGTATGTINVTLTSTNAPSLNIVAGPALVDNQFQVTFAGIPGLSYTVEDSTNSITGPWSYLTNLTAGSNGLFQLLVTNDPPATLRFFRTIYP
jgi:autotransporter-associated beta strand protein